MVEVPRYEVAVRRAVNPSGTKFKIHTRAHASLPADSFVEFDSWRDAWRDLRGRYPAQVLNEVYDSVTFQDEFEATMARDGEGVAQNPAEVSHANWEPLLAIKEVDETVAAAMYAEGMQSVYAVAAATLDELEAIPGSSVAKAAIMQSHARELCAYQPETEDDAIDHEQGHIVTEIVQPRIDPNAEDVEAPVITEDNVVYADQGIEATPTMEGLTADPVAAIAEAPSVAPASPFDLPDS